jgi:hypothetical protein
VNRGGVLLVDSLFALLGILLGEGRSLSLEISSSRCVLRLRFKGDDLMSESSDSTGWRVRFKGDSMIGSDSSSVSTVAFGRRFRGDENWISSSSSSSSSGIARRARRFGGEDLISSSSLSTIGFLPRLWELVVTGSEP